MTTPTALFLSLMFCSASAFAVCNTSATTTPATINYGSNASQTVPAGGISPNGAAVDATFSVTCSSALTLQLLSLSSWLRYTAQQPLNLSNGIDTVSYTLASNSTYTPGITAQGQSVGGPSGFSLLGLGVLASGRIDIPLHVKTNTTTLWPSAGTYTATQTLTVDGNICTSVSIAIICLGYTPVNATVTMSMTMVVSKSCEFISTPTLVDFGSVSFLENTAAAQLSVSIRCTNQEDYLLYADNGNNYTSGSRYLKSAGGQSIAYQIFQPSSTTQILGVTNPLNRLGTGMSETVNLPVRITTGQSTPVAGTYTDNVRMVIEY
ncbi:MAG: hypothetical protein B0W54_08805 [Cellvibrio sp. 79]|nr:MAG: hypothetical protein B0W54_08805 [Cellvibrio sp. 79]